MSRAFRDMGTATADTIGSTPPVSDIMPCQLDKIQPQIPYPTRKAIRTKTSNSFTPGYFAVSASFQTHEPTVRTNCSIFMGPTKAKQADP
jgi:hypothetical protein